MPMQDFTLVLSADQDTESTEISENVLDLTDLTASQQLGYVWINVVVNVTYDNSSTIQVAVMQDSDAAVGDGVEVMKSQAFSTPSAGTVLMSIQIPLALLDRYVGLEYTMGGSYTNGSVDAWIGMEPVNESLNIQAAQPTPSPS